MKKKIITGMATIFFAVVTVANLNMLHLNGAGDVSLESIAVMAQAQLESESSNYNVYVKGTWGTNWRTYDVECTYNTTVTNRTDWGVNYDSSGSIGASVPGTPYSGSLSWEGGSVHYHSSTEVTRYSEPVTIMKKVCGSGTGTCLSPAPSGDPCV